MPRSLNELALMISKRDSISYNSAVIAIHECAEELEDAFYNGSLDDAEDILRIYLGLEPDYLDLFLF